MKSLFYNLAGGLNTASTKTDLGLETQRIYWADAQNVEIFKNKGVTRQNGNELILNSPANKPILGIFGYRIEDKEIILFHTDDGEIYYYDSPTETTMKVYSGLKVTTGVSYTRFLMGVVISNGSDDPIYFTHLKPTEIKHCNAVSASGVNIRGKAITSYKSRLWIAMGGSLYFSALGRYDDWSTANDAGYISNFLADIDEITALQPYADYMAIYKRDSTFLLSGTKPADFSIERFADKGAKSQSMVINVNNKQYFINNSVFTLELSGVLAQISLGNDLSLDIKPEFEMYNNSSPYKGVALHYEPKNQIWIFCPTISNIYISTVLIYDYVNRAWTKRVMPQPITSAMCLNNKIYTASLDGKIYLEDSGHSFDGEPISFFWKSPFFSLGEPNLRKSVEDFYFLLDDNFDNNFKFSTFKNFDASLQDDTVAVTTEGESYLIWDDESFPWADDLSGGYWTNLGEGVYKADITQSNYSVQLSIEGDSLTENFALIGLEFKEINYD